MQGEGKVHWTGRVLSAEDVRRAVNGQQELLVEARTVITPSAHDELRARGVQIRRGERKAEPAGESTWAYSAETGNQMIGSVMQGLAREGIRLRTLPFLTKLTEWARHLADSLANNECRGCITFCQDAGFVCCVANKVVGLRAVAVANARQATRALAQAGANVLAVETGQTFFEIRQLVRSVSLAEKPVCPPEIRELEAHAHR
jgi:ribose 5-phosphate isomerase RpiB